MALFLYSLLPIVRNTATRPARHPGLAPRVGRGAGPAAARPAAPRSSCRWPRASILAGIKTAAVINVGTATIGALIGAGGFGQPILTGIRRDDVPMILFEGAIPAACSALAVQGAFRPGRAVPRAARTADADQSTVRNWTQKYRVRVDPLPLEREARTCRSVGRSGRE